MLPSYYEFQNSVKILSGKNALENIPFELRNLGAKRPLLLTDRVLYEMGLIKHVVKPLTESGIEPGGLYADIPADSSLAVVKEIAGLYREMECDSLIALGGGSVLDTAKGVNILVSSGKEDLKELMGMEILRHRLRPFIAIPTTAGTGSEATLVAVVANPDQNVKMEFISYHLIPDVAVLDPRLTLSLPPRVTAATGMDALAHAVEAYTSVQKNPVSDAYAWAAVNLIRAYLPRAVADGHDEEARLAMANAALLAGAAFSNAMVGVVHAIGHACGGVSHVPHGVAMAVLLPYGMEYNQDKVGDAYGELLLPLAGAEVYARTPLTARADKAIACIREFGRKFQRETGLPVTLREAGVAERDLERIATTALNDGAIIANPKEVAFQDIMEILRRAF